MWIFLAVPSRVCERWVHTLHQYHSSRPGGSFTRIWNWPNLEYWENYLSFTNMELANPRIFKTKYFCFENIELANPRIFQKKMFCLHNYGTGQPWRIFKYKQLLLRKLSMSKRRNITSPSLGVDLMTQNCLKLEKYLFPGISGCILAPATGVPVNPHFQRV